MKKLQIMTVYKRVLIRDGKFVSYVSEDPDLRLTYKIGKIAKPKIRRSGLFAFKTLEAAKGTSKYSTPDILKCVALVNPRRRKKTECGEYNLKAIKRFWEGKFVSAMHSLPEGALYCEQVQPLEHIPHVKLQ